MNDRLIITLNGDPLADFGTEHAGGQCKYVLELASNLASQNWQVHVVTLGKRAEVLRGEFTLTRLARQNGRPYGYDLTEQEALALSTGIKQAIEMEPTGFRFILACYWISALAARPLCTETGWPMIITFCQLGYFKLAADKSPSVIRRAELEAELGRHSQAVIATNRAEAAVLRDVYKIDASKISIIPRGIDLRRFSGTE